MTKPTQIAQRSIFGQNEANHFGKKLRRFLERQAYNIRKLTRRPICAEKLQEEWPADRPLISVIIPCYNYGRFIQGAIESVLAQTFQRFEIIVIDDGSTDEATKQVLRKLPYNNTTVIEQKNQGLAETRNNGAAMAAGKYICFLDPDDFIEPTYLEKTLSILESDESLGSCYSWVQCFGDRNSVWQTDDLEPFLLTESTTAPSHSVIRKQAWEDVKQRNGSGFVRKYDGYFEDWVFWIDMVQCGHGGRVIKEPLIRYRVHADSLGATHKPGFEGMLKVLREDRSQFFGHPAYRWRLEKKLNRKIYVQNKLVNLSGR